MDYRVILCNQLRPYLQSLRKVRGLTQSELARILGVGQSRMADIEANPGVMSVGQFLHLLGLLDAELIIRHTPRGMDRDAVAQSDETKEPRGEW